VDSPGMGYEGSWVWRGMLKIDSKNHEEIVKILEKYKHYRMILNHDKDIGID
jgi:hypothetical protein